MAEQLDVLDENGHKTGVTKTKDEIMRAGDWREVVHVWVVSASGEMLVQRRAFGRGIFDGQIDVSVGGGIRTGETSAAAGARELGEELGIHCSPDDLEYVGRFKIEPKPVSTDKVMNDFSDTFLLRRAIHPAALQLQPDEVSEVWTASLDELRADWQNPDTYLEWVPHGPSYYLDAADKIIQLMGL